MPELLEKPLDSFDRLELSLLAGSMRFDPPKIRQLIKWMDEQGINSLAEADKEALIEQARHLGFSVYGDTTEAIMQSGDSGRIKPDRP